MFRTPVFHETFMLEARLAGGLLNGPTPASRARPSPGIDFQSFAQLLTQVFLARQNRTAAAQASRQEIPPSRNLEDLQGALLGQRLLARGRSSSGAPRPGGPPLSAAPQGLASQTLRPQAMPPQAEVQRRFAAGAAQSPRRLQNPEELEGFIREAAREHRVPEELVRAVIKVESNFNPRATSSAGAMGLMQLMPGTARDMGVKNPYDPRENIYGGTRYLRELLDRYDGNVPLALAAYNWGMGNLESGRPLPEETRNYLELVGRYFPQDQV